MQNFSSKLQAQILGRKCALYFNPATICLKAFHTFSHLQLSDFEIFYFEQEAFPNTQEFSARTRWVTFSGRCSFHTAARSLCIQSALAQSTWQVGEVRTSSRTKQRVTGTESCPKAAGTPTILAFYTLSETFGTCRFSLQQTSTVADRVDLVIQGEN